MLSADRAGIDEEVKVKVASIELIRGYNSHQEYSLTILLYNLAFDVSYIRGIADKVLDDISNVVPVEEVIKVTCYPDTKLPNQICLELSSPNVFVAQEWAVELPKVIDTCLGRMYAMIKSLEVMYVNEWVETLDCIHPIPQV